jgi:hypothetical protein
MTNLQNWRAPSALGGDSAQVSPRRCDARHTTEQTLANRLLRHILTIWIAAIYWALVVANAVKVSSR